MPSSDDGDLGLTAEEEAFCRYASSLEEQEVGVVCKCILAIKVVLAIVFLFPIRFFFVWVILFCMWFVSFLSECCNCTCGKKSRGGTPHTCMQRQMLRLNGFLCRCMLFNVGVVWINVKGRPAGGYSRPTASTIVGNHVTMMDVFVCAYLMGGRVTAVAADWLANLPLFGGIGKAHHVLFVPGATKVAKAQSSSAASDRQSPVGGSPAAGSLVASSPLTSGVTTVPAKTGAQIIQEYQRLRQDNMNLVPLVIFPEGGTKAEKVLMKFRKGAFISGLPVQPVVFRFPHRYTDLSWVQNSAMANLFRILTQWVHIVEVEWLDMCCPNEQEKKDPDLFASKVQSIMATAMGLPPERSSHTVDSVKLARWRRVQDAKPRARAVVPTPAESFQHQVPGPPAETKASRVRDISSVPLSDAHDVEMATPPVVASDKNVAVIKEKNRGPETE